MFTDVAVIEIKAGNGGNGAISFHRDKFTPFGGPDGGNGGRGGDVVFVADRNLSTLADLRYKTKYFAKNGQDGSSKKRSGKSAENLLIKLPLGTLVIDENSKEILCDLHDFEPFIAANGGKGGAGNINFANSIRQVPRYAKFGRAGEGRLVRLELRLIADVGLIGLPNAGKSTIISVISNAKPKIADYSFTTLSPVLGVVTHGEKSFVAADIPGLIEGSSRGAGLGHEFLRHIKRCRVLIHVVDISEPKITKQINNFELINSELSNFSADLLSYPMIVAANKCDISSPEKIDEFKDYIRSKGFNFFEISALKKQGLDKLLNGVLMILDQK
ncbi:MAG: GTPase ObgE [Oscillospiraceae bacterium]|jgi:GTP-binding protein|nr:GTPase ObgE [Oscillospiraceae bacterium]